jgi:hypothetical protein
MIKRLELLKNNVNKYMADLRPTSQNGSWSKSTTRCIWIACHIFKRPTDYFYIVVLPCAMTAKLTQCICNQFFLSASRPTSLPASIRAPCFTLWYLCYPH